MKKFRRTGGILAAALLMLVLASSAAFAEDEAPSGEPVEIKTIDQLDSIRNAPDKNYILAADLDLSDEVSEGGGHWNGGQGWTPICPDEEGFTGTFDGNSHTISGVFSEGSNGCIGLFGKNSGVIKNLAIKDSSFAGSAENIGSVAGVNAGTIENCSAACGIKVTEPVKNSSAGGITGTNSGEVLNCSFEGSISKTGGSSNRSAIGGIVGSDKGNGISSCKNSGEINATGDFQIFAGGIAGLFSGDMIIDCENTGAVSVKSAENVQAGGIAGRVLINGSVEKGIYSCRNKGAVTADSRSGTVNAGGIAGNCDSTGETFQIQECSNESRIYAVGEGSYVGGIAGISRDTVIEKSFNLGEVQGTIRTVNNDCMCGGVVGRQYGGAVRYSYNKGNVKSINSGSRCAGITGSGIENEIRECYNTGTISTREEGNGSAGGICVNSHRMINCYNAGLIKGSSIYTYCHTSGVCAAASDYTAFAYNAGRMTGVQKAGVTTDLNSEDEDVIEDDTLITISYAAPAVLKKENGKLNSFGKALSYSDMLKSSSYAGYDFDNVWEMGTGPYKFPVLKNVVNPDEQSSIDLCECIGMHPFGAWKTERTATAAQTGLEKRTCYFCGQSQTRTVAPAGRPTIRNTIANSAKKTSDVIWDKSGIRGATGYELNWRARGAGRWAVRNTGNTARGTVSGLTIGNLYEIRVRPYAADASGAAVYGSWSDTIYRYFHTTEKIRLASGSRGTFTMKWKNNPKAAGYQVLYTTSPNGTGAAENIKKAGKGATGITVSDIKVNGKKQKLRSGTTYYVQVREIREAGGKNYIGNISIPLAVKVR